MNNKFITLWEFLSSDIPMNSKRSIWIIAYDLVTRYGPRNQLLAQAVKSTVLFFEENVIRGGGRGRHTERRRTMWNCHLDLSRIGLNFNFCRAAVSAEWRIIGLPRNVRRIWSRDGMFRGVSLLAQSSFRRLARIAMNFHAVSPSYIYIHMYVRANVKIDEVETRALNCARVARSCETRSNFENRVPVTSFN